ncbi:large ribosomal subunit protein P2y-like isoform X3 [Rhododendron vialii]|nr:large ribosomal subunit protein P2y-like isoform X3 [Rhododendron vialii]
MKIIAAYLLAVLGVGAEVDDERVQLLLSEVKGKDITDLIASGREKLASVPSGGGGGAVAMVASSAGGGAPAALAASEAKKEEKEEEKEELDGVLQCRSHLHKCFSCGLSFMSCLIDSDPRRYIVLLLWNHQKVPTTVVKVFKFCRECYV